MSKFEKLGKYIVECDDRNANNEFGLSALRGVSINKEFIESKANMDGVSLTPYKLVKPNEFCFVTITSRNGEKISLAQNSSPDTYIVSSSYIVFRIIDEYELLPDYLYLILSRPEFDRYARFNSWGSAREAFTFESMKLTDVCVPSPVEQQKVVNAWKACREIKEQNEAKAAPLMQLCQSYIQELKHKYPAEEIGPYIEEVTRTNKENLYKIDDVRGVSNEKVMRDYKGSLTGRDLSKFLVIKEGEFVFNKRTNAGLGLCLVKNRPYIFTEDYEAFRVLDKEALLPDYLYLFFANKDFDRYILYNSWGSAVVFFHIDDMKRVKIPLPPPDVQHAIVNIYKCANEAKQIAAEADRLSREVCPALLQHIIHN